jgi:alpha-glucosidase (family GH31 glycosyl hydrolase)
VRFFDGESGATMHNRYPVVYARATRRVIDEYEREHPRRSVFFFTRAGYTGRPGSAAYENANFPGDETTDWTGSSGIASVVPDMLNRAIGGAYGFTTDIGGYFDVYTGPTSKELFLRWAQLTALTPFFRVHGSLLAGVHTPWSYDAQTVGLYRALSRLHDRARPLILRLWREAVRTGVPPTRPLWLAYPRDSRAAAQDQEWLLGPDVLVAPVVVEGARIRTVYFPRGCWRARGRSQAISGPRTQTVAAPLARLPYFARCGSRPFGG